MLCEGGDGLRLPKLALVLGKCLPTLAYNIGMSRHEARARLRDVPIILESELWFPSILPGMC